MRIYRFPLKTALAAAVALFCCGVCYPDETSPYQRDLRSPLMTAPAIIAAGGDLAIEVTAKEDQTKPAIVLSPAGGTKSNELSLSISSITSSGDSYFLKAPIPAGAAEGLYDLSLVFEDETKDSQPHAVKIVKEFKKTYVFVHLTDIHFNMGMERNPVRMKILDMISELNPEFVLFGGDLGLNPETYSRDYPFGRQAFIDHLSAPIYAVPGNHELYIDNRVSPPIDGKTFWKDTYGPSHMSFDYGSEHYVGINDFDWPDRLRDKYDPEIEKTGAGDFGCIGDEQWDWLKRDVSAAAGAGRSIVFFTHVPVELLNGGNRLGSNPSYKVPGPSYGKFLSFMNKLKVSHVFVGHVHMNSTRRLSPSVTEIVTTGAGHNNYNTEKKWGFRVVYVEDGKIVKTEVREIGFEDLK